MDGDQATLRDTIGRDGNGRFAPGCSGNPAGKRKGTRNRATLLAEALRDGEGEAVARIIIDKALAGDAVAARFCLGLMCPKPRGRAITIDLPEGARPGDVVAAFNATLAAMAAGEITPDEALVVTKVLDGRLRALKAWQLEEDLTSYDRIIPGDALMLDDEEELEDEEEDYEEEDYEEEGEDIASSPATAASAPPRSAAPSSAVIPSKDGIHSSTRARPDPWIPSFDGMTKNGAGVTGMGDRKTGPESLPCPSPAFPLHLAAREVPAGARLPRHGG